MKETTMIPDEPRIIMMLAIPHELVPPFMKHLSTLPAEHLARIMVGHCGLEAKTEGESHE
jgi:hypothetical protein